MAEFPALPLWTDAYLGDTTHLSTTEHGAFLLLLITSWRAKSHDLPDDDRLLAKYARLGNGQWRRIRPVLEPFFKIENGRWLNERLLDELETVRRLTGQRSNAGRANALKRWNRGSTAAQRGHNGEMAPTPTPTPIEEKDVAKATSKKTVSLGTRLDLGWLPSDADRAFAVKAGLNPDVVAEEFRDYWIGCPGARGRKADWPATFRNWCRKNAERSKPRASGQNGHAAKPAFRNGWTELVHARFLADGIDGDGHDPQDVAPAASGDPIDAGSGGGLAARPRRAH